MSTYEFTLLAQSDPLLGHTREELGVVLSALPSIPGAAFIIKGEVSLAQEELVDLKRMTL